jgi:hypothetical protein
MIRRRRTLAPRYPDRETGWRSWCVPLQGIRIRGNGHVDQLGGKVGSPMLMQGLDISCCPLFPTACQDVSTVSFGIRGRRTTDHHSCRTSTECHADYLDSWARPGQLSAICAGRGGRKCYPSVQATRPAPGVAVLKLIWVRRHQ